MVGIIITKRKEKEEMNTTGNTAGLEALFLFPSSPLSLSGSRYHLRRCFTACPVFVLGDLFLVCEVIESCQFLSFRVTMTVACSRSKIQDP